MQTTSEQPLAQGNSSNPIEDLRFHLVKAEENRRASIAGLAPALEEVTGAIHSHWSTGGGTALRQFVWSLWNGQHYVNLQELGTKLDSNLARAVGVIFKAYVCGGLREQDLKQLLCNSGEFARWERESEQTPKGELTLYPPLPFSSSEARQLAHSAAGKASREDRQGIRF